MRWRVAARDFTVGTDSFPDLPARVERYLAQYLTTTVDGRWPVVAYKSAYREADTSRAFGYEFIALNGTRYPFDAIAECRRRGGHRAPAPRRSDRRIGPRPRASSSATRCSGDRRATVALTTAAASAASS